MKQITKIESPIMDVILKCTCAALDQTDCNYIVALFGRNENDFKVANITLNIEDEKVVAEAFAQVISDKKAEGKLLLRLLATIIDILPEDIWQELDIPTINGKGIIGGITGDISSAGVSSVGGGISL